MYIAFQYLLLLTFFYDSLKLLSVLVTIHFTDQTNGLSFPVRNVFGSVADVNMKTLYILCL